MAGSNKIELEPGNVECQGSPENGCTTCNINRQESPEGGYLIRMFWMMHGNLLPVICGLLIIRHGKSFSSVDVFYWLSVGMLALARHWDITRYHGADAFGKPATIHTWRHYVAKLFVVYGLGWIGAHLVAYFCF